VQREVQKKLKDNEMFQSAVNTEVGERLEYEIAVNKLQVKSLEQQFESIQQQFQTPLQEQINASLSTIIQAEVKMIEQANALLRLLEEGSLLRSVITHSTSSRTAAIAFSQSQLGARYRVSILPRTLGSNSRGSYLRTYMVVNRRP
jgi:hypothetical protein